MGINLIWNIIFILALSQGVFLGLVHLIQYLRTRLQAHLFLALFVLAFSHILLYNLIYWNGLFGQYPQLLFTNMSVRFLLPPLFFLYFQSFRRKKIRLKDGLHFLPFIIAFYFFAPVSLNSGEDKLNLVQNVTAPMLAYFDKIVRLSSWSYAILLLAYPIYIFVDLKRLFQKVNHTLKEKVNQLLWLRFLNVLFLLYGLAMISFFCMQFFDIGGIKKDFYISLVLCIAIYAISYIGMIHPELLKGTDFLLKIPILKYKKAKLTDSYLQSITSKMNSLMDKKAPYLDADYNLNQLSETLDIPRHHISQALSLILGKSFNEYINTYRVKYAKTLLKQQMEGQNIKTVMYESGFNNRVSFNNNFKKITGLTASEYLKQQS